MSAKRPSALGTGWAVSVRGPFFMQLAHFMQHSNPEAPLRSSVSCAASMSATRFLFSPKSTVGPSPRSTSTPTRRKLSEPVKNTCVNLLAIYETPPTTLSRIDDLNIAYNQRTAKRTGQNDISVQPSQAYRIQSAYSQAKTPTGSE